MRIITNDGRLVFELYDKRDSFPFNIVSFPDLSGNVHYKKSHGVIVGQLIRYAKICDDKEQFKFRCGILTNRLLRQSFDRSLLEGYATRFFRQRPDLRMKYKTENKEDWLDLIFTQEGKNKNENKKRKNKLKKTSKRKRNKKQKREKAKEELEGKE